MRALLVTRFGAAPELCDVPDPQCPRDGVVLRVAATGVCRSDWHAWQGHDSDVALPHVPGHELAGTVAAVGPDVRSWRPGERVTVPFVNACGRCEQCRAGQHQVCVHQSQPGFTSWGSFAELVAVEHADVNLVRLPDALPWVAAASLGCRFSTAYRAVVVQGGAVADQWVAVHGCGGVGLSAVMVAVALGARVVAVDVSPGALRRAGELGAEALVDASDADVVRHGVGAAVREVTGGGAHVSLDAFGSVPTCLASVDSLRTRGRHVQVGLLLGSAAPPVDMGRVLARELSLVGSHGMAAHDLERLVALVADGTLDPQRLVGPRIGLADVPAALAAMGSPAATVGMTVVEVDPPPHPGGPPA